MGVVLATTSVAALQRRASLDVRGDWYIAVLVHYFRRRSAQIEVHKSKCTNEGV
jgi:hypothetical protein